MHPFAFSDALPPDEDGMLLVKGPNVMRGYLGQLEKTKEVITDGWYHTGGVAAIDDDGFIHITDRLSRCSKIGGEMVPQIKVEETVSHVLGGNLAVATAVPDDRKGEPGVSREELSMRLAESGLPSQSPDCRNCGCRSAKACTSSTRSLSPGQARSIGRRFGQWLWRSASSRGAGSQSVGVFDTVLPTIL